MNKFDLVDAASKVYQKAEEIYKDSEINSDTLDRVIDKFFSKKYSEKQLNSIREYFKEQEEIFAEMEDADLEEARINRKLHKGDTFKNPNGVICTIIDVDENHLLDGEPQVTYKIGKDYKCFKMSSVSGMLDQNKYTLQESFKPSDDNWVGKMKDTNGTFFDLYQAGNKFYDVLGNEIDKSIVIDYINKSKKTESYSELPQMEIYEMIQTARNIDNQDKETNIKETIEAIKCDYPEINEEELAEYVKLKADEIYAGEYDESKKVITESNEITIPGLTNYENIADTFKNYRAFAANFEPVVIVKINRQYYVYKTDAESSQDYKYQTSDKENMEGWLYGAVMANNGIFKDITRENRELKSESTNHSFVIALSKKSAIELILQGESYDVYVKDVNNDDYTFTSDIKEAKRFDSKSEANTVSGDIKNSKNSEYRSVVVIPYESITEDVVAEYDTASSLINKLKNFLDAKFSDKVDTKTVSLSDGTAGIRITRKHNEDLIQLSDLIISALTNKGIKKNEYEIDLKGNDLIVALDNVQV